jgi:hypothetical protein
MIAEAAGDHHSARKHLILALGLNPLFHPIQAPIAAKTLERITSAKPAETAASEPAPSKP